jgi:hypothetical protein
LIILPGKPGARSVRRQSSNWQSQIPRGIWHFPRAATRLGRHHSLVPAPLSGWQLWVWQIGVENYLKNLALVESLCGHRRPVAMRIVLGGTNLKSLSGTEKSGLERK